MALFERLLRLFPNRVPKEDFFTEVVAHLFEQDHDLLIRWLRDEDVISSNRQYKWSRISTQHSFDALEAHSRASRPDLRIDLWGDDPERKNGTARDVIFVESKIDASEGYNQLRRYADHLAGLSGVRNRVLLYVTRDFDPKDDLPEATQPKVCFKPLRWHGFYQFLEEQQTTPLIREILHFMQSQAMDRSNRFTPAKVSAVMNFRQVQRLMDDILSEKAGQRFKKIMKGKDRGADSFKQFESHRRYVRYARFKGMRYYLGFATYEEVDPDYPSLILSLQVNPASSWHDEGREAFRHIKEKFGWELFSWDASDGYPGVRRVESLRNVLQEDDHVDAIDKRFNEWLNELEEIKQAHQNLPWPEPKN